MRDVGVSKGGQRVLRDKPRSVVDGDHADGIGEVVEGGESDQPTLITGIFCISRARALIVVSP